MSVDPRARFLVIAPGEGDVIAWRARMRLLAGAQSSEDRLTILETENPPQGGPPLHRHNREDEAFYVRKVITPSSAQIRSSARPPARSCSSRKASRTAIRQEPRVVAS